MGTKFWLESLKGTDYSEDLGVENKLRGRRLHSSG
jgi:hypothetical protein